MQVMKGQKMDLWVYWMRVEFFVQLCSTWYTNKIFITNQTNLIHIMEISIKIINKIWGGHIALTCRLFKDFLASFEADNGDLLLHTEIWYLEAEVVVWSAF